MSDTEQLDGQTTVEEQIASSEAAAQAQAETAQPFEISDEAAAEIAGPQLNLPMQTILLNGANIRIAHDEDSGERALIVGPVAFNLILPFTEESAKAVGAELAGVGGIVLAKPGDIAGEAAAAKKLEVVK